MIKICAESVYLKVSCSKETIDFAQAKSLIQKSIRIGTQNNLRGVVIELNNSTRLTEDAKELTLRILDKLKCRKVFEGF